MELDRVGVGILNHAEVVLCRIGVAVESLEGRVDGVRGRIPRDRGGRVGAERQREGSVSHVGQRHRLLLVVGRVAFLRRGEGDVRIDVDDREWNRRTATRAVGVGVQGYHVAVGAAGERSSRRAILTPALDEGLLIERCHPEVVVVVPAVDQQRNHLGAERHHRGEIRERDGELMRSN